MTKWETIFAQNRVIPQHIQRWKHGSGDTVGYQIVLGTLDGISSRQAASDESSEAQYQLRLSFFDITYHHFFGRTWKSFIKPMKTVTGQTSKVFFNEIVYFHTSLNDSGIVVVVEVISITRRRDGMKQESSCGFGLMRLFTSQAEEEPGNQQRRLTLYHGSPRALLHPAFKDLAELNRHMMLIEKSHVQYSVRTHSALKEVSHLLPPNILVSGSERIPGLIQGRDETGDALRKPHLQKTITWYLDRLYLLLYPSLEKFEEELLALINNDRFLKGHSIDGTAVVIQERRLHFGVHNGWGFVQQPQVVVVVPEARIIRTQSTLSLKKKPIDNQSSSTQALVLRSRIRLPEMVSDPGFSIVFQLEYVFCLPNGVSSQVPSATMLANASYMHMIRWASWSPLLNSGSSEVTLALQGGPRPNPCNNFVYKIPPNNMSSDEVQQVEAGTLHFNFNTRSEHHMGDTAEAVESLPEELRQSKKKSTTANAKALVASTALLQDAELGPALSMSQLTTSSRYPTISHSSKALQHVPSQLMPSPMAYPLSHAELLYASGITHLEADLSKSNQEPSNAEPLQELLFSPVHAPIVAMGTQTGSTSVLSRAALARLHSAGFPEILDCNNEVAEVADPSSPVNFNPQREEADYLQCNEIVLQFLAFSSVQEDFSAIWPQTIYFTFQFYRFQPVTTPRLQLVQSHSTTKSRSETPARLLVQINKDGSLNPGSPGYQLKYPVEPGFLKPGEQRWFLRYLALQTFQVDIWDGESLLLIGSAAVEMKHLLRQGRTAVQVSHELEVITTEYEQETMAMSGDVSKQGAVKPIGVHTVIKGRLHLRMGNVGRVSDQRLKVSNKLPAPRSRVITAHDGRSSFHGGSLFSSGIVGRKNISQAQKLADLDSELAAMLYSRMKEVSIAYQQPNSETDAAQRRKMERMMAVRQLESQEDPKTRKSLLLSQHEQRTQHTRDLQIIEAYRERTKAECISSMLNQAITSNYTVYATLGTAEFFEFQLKNPYNIQYTVSIEIDHPDLRVIGDTQEWRHFKELTNTTTPIEENMFHVQQQSDTSQLYLRPKETVYIPFKYQTFCMDQTSLLQMQSPDATSLTKDSDRSSQYKTNTMSSKRIKVSFKASDGKPIAILQVSVEPQPHVVDQTFRFYHPELTFLKKSIRLPPWYTLPGAPVGMPGGEPELYVRCSDPNIICDTKKLGHGEPQDVFLKVAAGPSPQIKRFFIALYTDHWLAAPIQIWQIYIHSLKRVDISCITGQLTQMSLVLRGTQVVRKVRAYSSHPQELQVDPESVFVLPPNGIQDLHIAVRPQKAGSKFIYLNLVDVDQHQLVASWLVCVLSRNPIISKAFEITVSTGEKGCNKRITYTNPYPTRKRYSLHTNRADLLQFKENTFEVGAGETYTIGLRFAPSESSGQEEILIFINDHEDKNEETFCVKVNYEQAKKKGSLKV
ncbi:nephrocystin-4 isoform X2 [Bufo gargarizans]|uniref:nephrocystin-4 isoform X2 n=1 Tax=Bufo gargarizans TaxID=30331 RepID=UPI001CF4A461|nr:nephrocystin-4 isoform X2 [Bufo gargarizans]